MKFNEVENLFLKEKEIIRTRWKGKYSYIIKSKTITSIQAEKLIRKYKLTGFNINAMSIKYVLKDDLSAEGVKE